MQHRDKNILEKIIVIIDESEKIFENISNEEFLNNNLFKLAASMNVIRIGELVKNLTDEFRKQNSHIAWRDITGFRDIASHKYDIIDMNELYDTIKNEFPELKLQIEKILENE